MIWGAGWGVLGTAVTLVLGATSTVDGVSFLDAIGMGVRIGVVGGIAGALFSTLISVAYRGRRIQDISWVKFGLGGAVVSAVGLPLFMQTASFLTGGGMVPWTNLYNDIAIFAAFGGVAAAASMKLAHIAARQDPDARDALSGEADSAPALPAGDLELTLRQTARSEARKH